MGNRGKHPTKDVGGWGGERGRREWGGAGHSVIQRVVSPHSAAGRGFTAKREKKRKGTKAADTLKGFETKRDVS